MSFMKILIVDNYPTARYGLRFLLECEPNMEIIGEAENGEPALEAVQALNPDLLVMDINMPEMAGLEVLKRLRQAGNPVSVIMLADHADTPYAQIAMEAGATAFLGKDNGFDALLNTIQCIHEVLAAEEETPSKTD